MLVVPDANILWSDPFLERPRFELIRQQAADGNFQLAVPEVVVREAVKLYREQLTDAGTRLRQAIDKQSARLRHLKADPELAFQIDSEELTERYETSLRERLSESGALILPLPDVSHDALVDRAVAARRPFRGHDSGYRDTLIWLTILEAADEDEVVLISANSEDFAVKGQPEVFHSDLIDDITAAALPDTQIQLLGSLERFIALHVPADAQARQDFELALADGTSPLRDNLLAALRAALVDQSLDEYESVKLPGSVEREGSTVGAVDEVAEVDLGEARGLRESESVLELSGVADLSVDYFVFKPDWYASEEEIEGVWLLDSDWNDHYVWVSGTIRAQVELVATVRRDDMEVVDLDVIDVTTS